jgi:hypothetical protein
LPDGVDEDTKEALGKEALFALSVLSNRHGGIDGLGGGTAGGGNPGRASRERRRRREGGEGTSSTTSPPSRSRIRPPSSSPAVALPNCWRRLRR